MEQRGQQVRSWRHKDEAGECLVSTALNLLDHKFINDMFATDDVYWASSVAPDLLDLMLSQSLNFGLYEVTSASQDPATVSPTTAAEMPTPDKHAVKDETLKQIGLARFVTDHVTFVYVTDVYIVREHRGRGLGKWMMKCWEEVMKDMPQLRRALLVTGLEQTKTFYEQGLGMWDSRTEGDQFYVMMRKRYPSGNK